MFKWDFKYNKVDVLIFYFIFCVYFIDYYPVHVISVSQDLGDYTNPNSFLTELLTAGLGQHQVLDIRKKSIDGVAVKAKQGIFLGGYPPLGYDIINGNYVINEMEAKTVRTIFKMYSNGDSYKDILMAVGNVRGKRGRLLGHNSLNTILKNDRYIGIYSWNRKQYKIMRKWAGGKLNPNVVEIKDIIPPIVDMDTWERVQKRMNDNKGNARNKAKTEYLLSGVIKCDSCGSTYVGHTSTNSKGYKTKYYVCGNKYRTHTCNQKNINANELETFVLAQLKEFFKSSNFEEIAENICNAVNSASRDLSKEKSELKECEKKIANGVRALLNGMDIPELKEEIDNLRLRKEELEDIISSENLKDKEIDKDKLIEFLKKSAEISNENVKSIIKDYITIYAHIDGTVTVNIGVHLKYCGSWI